MTIVGHEHSDRTDHQKIEAVIFRSALFNAVVASVFMLAASDFLFCFFKAIASQVRLQPLCRLTTKPGSGNGRGQVVNDIHQNKNP